MEVQESWRASLCCDTSAWSFACGGDDAGPVRCLSIVAGGVEWSGLLWERGWKCVCVGRRQWCGEVEVPYARRGACLAGDCGWKAVCGELGFVLLRSGCGHGRRGLAIQDRRGSGDS